MPLLPTPPRAACALVAARRRRAVRAAPPVLNAASFGRLRYTLGDAAALADVAGEFERCLPSYVADARRASRAGDLCGVAAAAHRMRGGAGVFGLDALAAHALRLEDAARAGRIRLARALTRRLAAHARAACAALACALEASIEEA